MQQIGMKRARPDINNSEKRSAHELSNNYILFLEEYFFLLYEHIIYDYYYFWLFSLILFGS
jgi:hypothetical protein